MNGMKVNIDRKVNEYELLNKLVMFLQVTEIPWLINPKVKSRVSASYVVKIVHIFKTGVSMLIYIDGGK